MRKILIHLFFLMTITSLNNCSYNSQLSKADNLALKQNFTEAAEYYKKEMQSEDEIVKTSAYLGFIDCTVKANDFKTAYSSIIEFEKDNALTEPFAEWFAYNKIRCEYNLSLYVEAYNSSVNFIKKYNSSQMLEKVKEISQLSMKLLGQSGDASAITSGASKTDAQRMQIKSIPLEILDFFKDDFGYLNVKGKTEPNCDVFIAKEKVVSDAAGIFEGKVIFRSGKTILIKAKKSDTEFAMSEIYDSEEPDAPRGLEIVNRASGSITIRWNENKEKDMLGYNIYFSLDKSKWEKVNRDDEIIKRNEYSFRLNSSISGATKIYIKITALDKVRNESSASDIIENP